jgi:hypothetical protein
MIYLSFTYDGKPKCIGRTPVSSCFGSQNFLTILSSVPFLKTLFRAVTREPLNGMKSMGNNLNVLQIYEETSFKGISEKVFNVKSTILIFNFNSF